MAISIAILDCDLLLHGRGQKTMDRFDLDSVSDHFLITHFGFPKTFILYLVALLRESLSRRTQRSRAISPEVQVMAALGFYTSGSYQTSMGDTIGISQASMSRCVSNVTKALVEKAPHFISFFRDESSKEQSLEMFERVAGFPGVIGVLDFVQVAIKAPNSEDQSYVNKKGLHSVGVQLVCDSRGLLLSAETHWLVFLGSSGSPIFSGLCDSRYPLRKWLMTPVDYPECPADFRYNLSHTTTHEIVDRTFRAIQTRFKCLDSSKGYLQVKSIQTLFSSCLGLDTE
uniref:Putative nuclease HARBI1 n=1 Tax=Periophthalmus magnuspinnatus TaxID=409849 RepID=A0A3B4B7I9_9GOBI